MYSILLCSSFILNCYPSYNQAFSLGFPLRADPIILRDQLYGYHNRLEFSF